jgi:neutral ceramidase
MSHLVGRGISDLTGEPYGCGMLGYGKADQVTSGIHTRLRTRAFVIEDSATGSRILLNVSDLPLMFDSVHREVLRRLATSYGDLYTASNVMLTVTHTHCGPGGYSHHRLYNLTTRGFRPKTFDAIVDGIVEAVDRAHADVGPATLTLCRGELLDASVNRSPESFGRNPAEDRAYFPDAIDPQTTLLVIERQGEMVGAINWFATHGTSMTNHNTLISGDNKGFAAYHWERVVHGIDYLSGESPDFIAAFAQTNAGDMSPNLWRGPGKGPTEDEFENTRIIGHRQATAAASLASGDREPVVGAVEARCSFVDLSKITVQPEFTGDGRVHRTSAPAGGAAALAGTDEGPGFPGFRQGTNPVWDWLSRHVAYRLFARLRDSQAPKGIVMPGGVLNRLTSFVQERVPVQLLRIGQLYLIGIPGEVTIVAGLRMRRAVASVVGADVRDVLVAGYSNAYIHYVTTPEEYEAQRYEGGSTLFGRWEAPALTQVAVELATAMRDGRPVDPGPAPTDPGSKQPRRRHFTADLPVDDQEFGDVVASPRAAYRPGEQVRVSFAGANPNNDLHRGGTYVEVEQQEEDGWRRIADDGDWETKISFERHGSAFRVTVTWDVPADSAGTYRIRYFGDAVAASSEVTAFVATTAPFVVQHEP